MSQPAVSKALRKMRVAFNDPLFIRAPFEIGDFDVKQHWNRKLRRAF